MRVTFSVHCNKPSCKLGFLRYTCPNCQSDNRDYNVWKLLGLITDGLRHNFTCMKCDQDLVIYYNGYYHVVQNWPNLQERMLSCQNA